MKKLSLYQLTESTNSDFFIAEKLNEIIDYINADDCYKTLNGELPIPKDFELVNKAVDDYWKKVEPVELPKEECKCNSYYDEDGYLVNETCNNCEPKEETKSEAIKRIYGCHHGIPGGCEKCEPKEESLREIENQNELKVKSFTGYCASHPDQRFWQALRNWAKENESKEIDFIGAGRSMENLTDTFHWK